MKKLCIALVFLFVLLSFSACEGSKIEPLIDASKFSRISTEELFELMGEPVSTDTWKSKVEYQGESYMYNVENMGCEFKVYEGTVVQMSIFPTYFDEDQSFGARMGNSILLRLGIEKPMRLTRVSDFNNLIAWRPVNEYIYQVAALSGIGPANKKGITNPGLITVMYDAKYFYDNKRTES